MTVRLVPFTDAHVAPMAETLRDPDVLRFTGTPVPTPPDWISTWRTRFVEEDRVHFAIVDGDEFVGYAVSGPIDRDGAEVEIGYAVAPWARGRGVATEALRLLTDWALAEGMQRVALLISVDNVASQRVAEKGGYTLEGVLRSVHHRNGERMDLQSWSLLPSDLGRQSGRS